VEEGFLDAVAFGVGGFVFEEGAVGVSDDEFVVGDFDVVFLEAAAVGVAEDAEFVLDGDEFVESGDEEVAGAYGGVADF